MPNTSPVTVSIIVPCCNESPFIGKFIDSLLDQDFADFDVEVLIADGMSDDGTREIVESYCERYTHIRIVSNPSRFVSAGLNLCIRLARGEIIVRMDVHTDYASDYVRQCVSVLQETGADGVGGPWVAVGTRIVSRAIAAVSHSCFGTGGGKSHDVEYQGPVDTVYLGCWRKATLEHVGLFDETFIRNQDDELSLRLIREGGKIWQSQRIVSRYHPRARLSDLFRQLFQYGFWKVPVIRKHRLPASWRHLAPGSFAAANLACALAVLIAPLHSQWAQNWAGFAWLTLLSVYGVACLLASVAAARRTAWILLPLLPVIFAIYHFAYGLGFLVGVLVYANRTEPLSSSGRAFTEITR